MESFVEIKRYSDQELEEFELLIRDKIAKANKEISFIKDSLTKATLGDINGNYGNGKGLEDGADTSEKEHLNQLAGRQQKFVKNLQNALIRIKNQTYGICVDTGNLIPKDRLRAVPHTMHTIEAKLNRN